MTILKDSEVKQILVFRYGVKARAVLKALELVHNAIAILVWRIIPMAGNFIDGRESRDKLLKKEAERFLLLLSPGVLGLLVLVEPAYITDADATFVVVLDVGANLAEGPALFDGTVQVNHEMISDLPESALLVPQVYVVGIEVLALYGIRAMDDDVCHFPFNREALFDVGLCFFSCHNYTISIP